jgi:hypothetical protein
VLHISFLFHSLGPKFKDIACGVLGINLCLEIQKERRMQGRQKAKKFNNSFRAASGCTLHLALAQFLALARKGEACYSTLVLKSSPVSCFC